MDASKIKGHDSLSVESHLFIIITIINKTNKTNNITTIKPISSLS